MAGLTPLEIEARRVASEDLDRIFAGMLRRALLIMGERAEKSFDADAHPRYPEGTAVDPETGAGGGRFAPKGGEGSPDRDGKPRPQGTPVSAAANVTATGAVGKAIREALGAVDEVHGATDLKQLPLEESQDTHSHGSLEKTAEGKPIRLVVSDKAETPAFTALHEIGHWLDFAALNVPFEHNVGEIRDKSLRDAYKEFWSALEGTKSYQSLIQTLRSLADTPHEAGYVRYLLRREEKWARAYSQYVATRSSSTVLKAELAREQGLNGYPQQWSDEDFAPVAAAIDKIFKVMGWME
ncbi:MAG: hypothetical protein IPK79_00685 [Vampirovibrionales bacterium]|nr:hypothetical protein [Vampirovibrionales bacterium]